MQLGRPGKGRDGPVGAQVVEEVQAQALEALQAQAVPVEAQAVPVEAQEAVPQQAVPKAQAAHQALVRAQDRRLPLLRG